MPIRPMPCTLKCQACGWRKTVAPASDALLPGEWYACCPRCGGGLRCKVWGGPIARTLAQWWVSIRPK
ncbi:hypothetical protein [Pseudomonas mosselii]|uniref:hypothetical protein n=1 Tax=Pseudomonas mosselii TaxID=78327 RepID=UPI003F310E15